ncbi:MAG: hypothetical protein ACLPXT_04500 [Terracidiphilus sp.]
MDAGIAKALIAAVGTLLGVIITAVIGPIVKDRLENRRSKQVRSGAAVPEIMGTKWEAYWNFQDGTQYTHEYVTFVRWTTNSQFEGYGEVQHSNVLYKYAITGEVSPRGIVALTYKAEKFPTEANIGTACLQLSASATKLDGFWVGLVAGKDADGRERLELQNGPVKMQKVKDLNE